MIHDRSKAVFASLRASFVFMATVSVAFSVSADSLSPYSVAQAVSSSPGVSTHTLTDVSPFDALVSRPVSTTSLEATAADGLKVRADARVQTNYGPVTATAVRRVSWSNLLKPWKKVLKAVPVVGTALTISEILDGLCIRQTSDFGFEQCIKRTDRTAANVRFSNAGKQFSSPGAACAYGLPSSLYLSTVTELETGSYQCVYRYVSNGALSGYGQASKSYWCSSINESPSQAYLHEGAMVCNAEVVEGYGPIDDSLVDQKLDNHWSQNNADALAKMPRLFDDLTKVPKTLPQDHQTVEPSGPTSVTGPSSKPGPSVTETTPDGQKVTTGSASITYNGDTSTVIHNTTTTYINNQGDVINETTTSEQKPSDCEVNPSAVACQELGDPGEGEIPASDQNWSITPESLPGGFCPPGFVFPIPGNPSFSWQPLCDNLPAARAVIILLSAVIAAWIVVGGLKS